MSFPRYPAYRDSGVEWLGEVPEHWTVRPLKHVTALRSGGTPSKDNRDFWDGSIAWASAKDLKRERLDDTEDHITQAAVDAGAAELVPTGAVLVVVRGMILARTFPVSITMVPMAINQDLKALVSFSDVNPAYLARALQAAAEESTRRIDEAGHGTKALRMDAWTSMPLPLPPAGEQADIIVFLDRETAKIDALVAEQEKLIALLQEKRQAVISHAVTKGLGLDVPMKDSGVEWLGEVPEHWEVTRIKHLALSMEQGWSPQCESYAVENPDEWGVLKVGCVNGGTFDPMENKALPLDLIAPSNLGVRAGDLLISRANTRELVGSAAVVLQDYSNLLLCDKLYRIRIDGTRCAPGFVALLLGAPTARGQIELGASGASSSMLNIGQSTIMDMVVALPPLPEQQAIEASILSGIKEIQHLSDAAANTIDLLKERRAALISAAVTGQIDVRGTVLQPAPSEGHAE